MNLHFIPDFYICFFMTSVIIIFFWAAGRAVRL